MQFKLKPMRIPALNEIGRQLDQEPKYPDDHEDKRYLILYPDDHQGYGSDPDGNVALLLNEENAHEVRRLANNIIDQLEDEEEE